MTPGPPLTMCKTDFLLCIVACCLGPRSPANPSSLLLSGRPPVPVVLGSQTLGANRMVARWNGSGPRTYLSLSSLSQAVHWQQEDGFSQAVRSLLYLSLAMTLSWVTPPQVPYLVATHTFSWMFPPKPRGSPPASGSPPPCPTTLTDVVKASGSQSLWQVSRVQERGQERHDHVFLVVQDGVVS